MYNCAYLIFLSHFKPLYKKFQIELTFSAYKYTICLHTLFHFKRSFILEYLLEERKMKYGYCRVSTQKQNIERQVRNIKNNYDDVVIVQEGSQTEADFCPWPH